MANKRISELSSRVPSASDLMLVGDPTTGYSYKCLVSQVGGVTSVFGRTGAVTAQEGDYTLTQLGDVTITSPASGDILTYNGSSWVNGAGGFVPYTGANQNVNLGEYGIRSGWYQFDLTPTGTPTTQSTMYWDTSFNTVALVMNGTTQEIGHDQFYQVKNSSGSTIPKGTAVGFAGTDGGSGHLLITPFIANGTTPSSYFMGVTAEAITNGSFGKVQNFGRLDGVDTSAFAEGDILYVSTTTAGAFQTTIPVAPNNIIQVAAVVSDSNNGKLLIRPTLGSKLTSDESVRITSVANGQVLQYNSSLAVWQNVAPSTLAVSNIYTADGTLTGNRTVTMGGNNLIFSGGGQVRITATSGETFTNRGSSAVGTANLNSVAYAAVYNNSQGGFVALQQRDGTSSRYGINGMSELTSSGTGGLAIVSSSGAIHFGTPAAEMMRIFTSGNIGINTTTDAGFRLDVNGTMRVQGNTTITTNLSIGTTTVSSSADVRLLLNSATGAHLGFGYNGSSASLIGSPNPSTMALYTSTGTLGSETYTERMRIASNGIVSIGTTASSSTPDVRLLVNGQTGGFVGFAFNGGPGGGIGSPSGSTLSFMTSSGTLGSETYSERMRIFSNGNIGINTTTDAGYRLDVNGTFRNVGFWFLNGGGQWNGRVGNAATQSSGAAVYLTLNGHGAQIQDQTAVNTTFYSTLDSFPSIAAATSVTAISHFSARNGALGAGASVTTQTGIDITALTLGSTIYGIRSQVASATNRWNLYINGTAANYIEGNVGIGTTSPTYKLHVVGDGQITGNVSMALSTATVGIGSTVDTSYKLSVDGSAKFTGIRTAQPTGGVSVADWKFGSTATGTFTMDTDLCLEVEVGGTLYRVALITPP